MSKDKFYEKLKDPDMAAVKAGVIAIINNPKNSVTSVTSSNYDMNSGNITLTIEVHVPDD